MYELDDPGIPLPGPDFRDMARSLGDQTTEIKGTGKDAHLEGYSKILQQLYREALYSNGDFVAKITAKGRRKQNLRVVSGHRWASPGVTGPVPADVMLIGKMLGAEEIARKRNFIGSTSSLMMDTMQELHVPFEHYAPWYVTNLMKTVHPLGPGNSSQLKKPWVAEWLPILHQELRIVRPKYILCLGADASMALLGKNARIKSMEGRVIEYEYPIHQRGEKPRYHKCLVMAITHPAAVIHAMELEDKFKNGMARFVQLTYGQRWDKEEEGLDHRMISDIDSLRALKYEIAADCEDNLLGVDAEWHGQHPQNEGSYLRSFQVSWREKTAAYIELHDEEGQRLYDEDTHQEALDIINEICDGRQLAGHFFDADLEFLVAFGVDLRQAYSVPDDWADYMRACLRGKACGFDTGLAAHALNETDDYSLTFQSLRHTTAPRYDVELMEWKKEYVKLHNMKEEELEGYGPCPTRILGPYGCYDADVTRRLAVRRKKQLCKDPYGNNCWEPFWMSMRALPAVLEINTKGVMVDRDRIDNLTIKYMTSRAELEQRIRDWSRWPDFNLNSVFQVREFLFGEELNGHEVEPGAPPRKLRPKGAISLRLLPVKTTDKRPMMWPDVVSQGLIEEKTPSTDKEALAILARESQSVTKTIRGRQLTYDFSEQVNWVRDYRFISQVLKSSLRPPISDTEEGEDGEFEVYRQDSDGHYVYAGGIAASICDDGRVRTHIYPTKETRRWASARPALQNLSKRREKDYRRILGSHYMWTLRSIICAPNGRVLVEADYVGAELFGMAIMAGDPLMIEHAKRNQLPEDHPDYYDIHSNIAVLAFGLDIEPTKAGLEAIDSSHLRIVAKSVIFGVAYGRGAKAIALAAKEEGIYITVEQAQQVIDTIFSMYPRLIDFFKECQQRAVVERWLCGCFGGFRRFPKARDNKTIGDFERQAMNFPIQGMIADAVNRAVDHLVTYRSRFDPRDRWFDIVLQIHDALLFEVDAKDVPWLVDHVIPHCMRDSVPIYPCHLDGGPKEDPNAPYYLGVDTEVGHHWGELMLPDEFGELGIDPKYGGWSPYEDGWRHVHKKHDHKWKNGEWLPLAA